ncbi:zinc-dependent metalloprotease [Hoylesella timonensis]|uniref:zinc-dependent metalloprotease n=1 Tax=Hoylesella timonensis TaxID=386414 RepID=UPI00242CB588|nr:zinc-dependent metalloprotease [Hoylesella timonensis]
MFSATSMEMRAACQIWPFFKKKKKTEKPISAYKRLTGRDSVEMHGVFNVIKKGDTIYYEIPTKLMGREFLVVNRLQRVPSELNESGVNKGINYENQTVRFEWDKRQKRLIVRQQRITPEVPSSAAMAGSVKDNYIDPILANLKIEGMASDSSTVIVKVNDLYNGKENFLNDVFNNINLGTSPIANLSRIIDIKAFKNNVTATSELTTTVHEGNSKVNVTVVVSSSLSLLPKYPMQGREEDARVGYFTTSNIQYNDYQNKVEPKNYITRWRLVPSDTAAYLRGELVEPVQPIVFYIDQAVPKHLRPYIKKGMTDWNKAFERAGFKNAIQVFDYTDSLAQVGDDMGYSVLTYAASTKANAMGPSVIDPRTGEILEADIVWWHNVQSLISEWIKVQTGAQNPQARRMRLPEELIGDAVRFVACHEVGHSLGLRHNMIASNAYPTDSLRSVSFTQRMGGTSSSIMDYARFNYVAQPGDGVKVMSPNIGPYDLMAIEWGYRWYPQGTDEQQKLNDFLEKHRGRLYKYSEAQPQRTAIDPRALSEDLGDDAVKSARYGIANLKRIVPNIIKWTTTGKPGQDYDEASNLYSAVIYQWSLYLYHIMANVGGMYLENLTVGDGQTSFHFVEKNKQRQALQFLLDEVLSEPKWLFDTPLSKLTYLQRKTPLGVEEQQPFYMLKNQQNYILWDLLNNDRLMRMYENEYENGKKAFTPVEFMDMLHRHIFKTTLAAKSPNLLERNLQKSFIDALITAAAEGEGVKINKKLYENSFLDQLDKQLGCQEETYLSSKSRNIQMTNTQVTRNSDALSLKRGEMIRVMKLLKSRLYRSDTTTRLHYEDVILRIQTALGLTK